MLPNHLKMRKKFQIERVVPGKVRGGNACRKGRNARLPFASAALFPVTATIIAQILNFSHFWQIPHKIGTIYKRGGSKRLRPMKKERKCITMPAV